ncbi:hypothetical protein CYMTET_24387, partial [Cymbomonas tetramitiformis]
MDMSRFNDLAPEKAVEEILRCCGSTQFAQKLAAARPYGSFEELITASRNIWKNEVCVTEWLAAFKAHPRIGDVDSLRKKFATTADWCEGEQSAAMRSANEDVINGLAQGNTDYEAKFGFIFIICATGKPAGVILDALRARLPNSPHHELKLAALEQQKITEIRLQKLLGCEAPPVTATAAAANRSLGTLGAHLSPAPAAAPTAPKRAPITTHVLDISIGRPAEGIPVTLEKMMVPGDATTFEHIGKGVTDADGRIGTLLEPGSTRQ